MNRLALVLLLPLLALLLGASSSPQTSEQQAEEKADFIPRLDDLYSKPTVEPSGEYFPDPDEWRVTLVEQTSRIPVARFTLDDDGGGVSQLRVFPEAREINYPTLSENQAIKLAATNAEVQNEFTLHGPHTASAKHDGETWTVSFLVEESGVVGGKPYGDSGQKEVARVGVNDETWELEYVYVGDQVGWGLARGESGAYGKQANYWYVWGPLALAFVLAFLRPDKLYSLRNLDVVAMLGFLVSHGFFREGAVFEAVVLWYPPLIYLLVRTALMGFGIGERVEKTSPLPTPVLLTIAGIAGIAVLALNLDSRVIDVGYAGVVGADRILDGVLPYGNMPADVGTGDTYGPLNYILYVPFVVLFGFSGEWDFLPAAHGVTAFAFVGGGLALFYAGWRTAGGMRGGAAMMLAWTVFPYTLYATNNNTNDIIVAAFAALGLALASSPLSRGAVVAAGFAVKLYPLLLAPLWMLHDGWRKRPITDFVIGGLAVVVMSSWVLFLDEQYIAAMKLFYEKTITFQSGRQTPWTIFTQVPALGFLKTPLTVAVALFAASLAFVPRKRTVRRLAALSAAVVIGFQLTTNYWYYPYVTWFEPFIFLALLTATNEKTELDGSPPPRHKT